jgi:hypothetical protein
LTKLCILLLLLLLLLQGKSVTIPEDGMDALLSESAALCSAFIC